MALLIVAVLLVWLGGAAVADWHSSKSNHVRRWVLWIVAMMVGMLMLWNIQWNNAEFLKRHPAPEKELSAP